MDQYVSWGLPTDQLTLEIIWGKFEDFCKPQSNEVFMPGLTSSQASAKEIGAWMSSIMQSKLRSI